MSTPLTANQNRFLHLLAWCEGTSTSPLTRNMGYDVIVSGVDGGETFADYTHHPFASPDGQRRVRAPKVIRLGTGGGGPLLSTASGRYQVIYGTYRILAARLGNGPLFYPIDQDAMAVELLREVGALASIEAGDIPAACGFANRVWASIPGSTADQGGKSLQAVLEHWALLTTTLDQPPDAGDHDDMTRTYKLTNPQDDAAKIKAAGGPDIDLTQPGGTITAHGCTFSYTIAGDRLAITLQHHPFFAPESMIASKLDAFFGLPLATS